MSLLPAAMATVAIVLAAAKAHGRQVRLEREQQGVFHVDFGGTNPPAVERIWWRDRVLFWTAMALAAIVFLGLGAWLGSWQVLAFALPWAFASAFAAAGLASWGRLLARHPEPSRWRRRAMLGSVAWWLGVLAAAALVAWAF